MIASFVCFTLFVSLVCYYAPNAPQTPHLHTPPQILRSLPIGAQRYSPRPEPKKWLVKLIALNPPHPKPKPKPNPIQGFGIQELRCGFAAHTALSYCACETKSSISRQETLRNLISPAQENTWRFTISLSKFEISPHTHTPAGFDASVFPDFATERGEEEPRFTMLRTERVRVLASVLGVKWWKRKWVVVNTHARTRVHTRTATHKNHIRIPQPTMSGSGFQQVARGENLWKDEKQEQKRCNLRGFGRQGL